MSKLHASLAAAHAAARVSMAHSSSPSSSNMASMAKPLAPKRSSASTSSMRLSIQASKVRVAMGIHANRQACARSLHQIAFLPATLACTAGMRARTFGSKKAMLCHHQLRISAGKHANAHSLASSTAHRLACLVQRELIGQPNTARTALPKPRGALPVGRRKRKHGSGSLTATPILQQTM